MHAYSKWSVVNHCAIIVAVTQYLVKHLGHLYDYVFYWFITHFYISTYDYTKPGYSYQILGIITQ